MRRTVWLFIVAISAAAVLGAGCNTMRGMGRDIERGGEKLQEVGR